MVKRKTALLMTVGTGVGGGKQVTDDLAHGILFSIDTYLPDKVIFFGSELSKKTIESIKEQYKDKFNEEFNNYEFIQLDNIDDFKVYFDAFKSKCLELSDYKIIIDYTSGTKTMTMAAAFTSMLFKTNLFFVSGERDKGVVKRGTEKIISQNLYPIYDDLMISKIQELFNTNRFEAGKVLINDLVGINVNKDVLLQLFDTYDAFDNVNYEEALMNFDRDAFVSAWPELRVEFGNNMKSLNILNIKKHNLRCYYILASMLNNARRRSEENKYDDAIARLYRSLELIAQIKLKKEYGIITSDVDIRILKEKQLNDEYIEKLELLRDNNSKKIRLGLVQDYVLLNQLDDDLGQFYMEKEKLIQNSLKFRNESILAHGLKSQNKQQYDEFKQIVLEAAKILKKDILKYVEETKFPYFESLMPPDYNKQLIDAKNAYNEKNYQKAYELYNASYNIIPFDASTKYIFAWSIYQAKIKQYDSKDELIKDAKLIINLTKQNNLNQTPSCVYTMTVFKVLKLLFSQKDYEHIPFWLDKIDPDLLDQNKITKDDKTYSSNMEQYYIYASITYFKLEDYENCINVSESALMKIKECTGENSEYFKWRIAKSNRQLENYQIALKYLNCLNLNEWYVLYEFAINYYYLEDYSSSLEYAVKAALKDGPIDMKLNLYKLLAKLLNKDYREIAEKHEKLGTLIRKNEKNDKKELENELVKFWEQLDNSIN